jgi:hypothetical protein
MASAFPHVWEDRGRTLIGLLATVGDADSCELLHVYVDDPDLGATAITTIKSLNDTRRDARPEPDVLSCEGAPAVRRG